jgi:alkylation response protein AidB-like acyl-CoA dehydrogenase
MIQRERRTDVPGAFQRLLGQSDPILSTMDGYLAEPHVRDRLRADEAAGAYSRSVLTGLRERGLVDLLLPDRATAPQLCGLAALTARHNGSVAVTVGVNGLGLLPVYIAGSPDQCATAATRLRNGQFAALMLSELAYGSNLLRNEASARPDGDGYRLQGAKELINGGAEHDIIVAFLRTDGPGPAAGPRRSPLRDFTLFLLERDATVLPHGRWRTLPVPAADISGVRFADTWVPANAVVGGVGQGFAVVQKTLMVSHGGVAAFASGAASGAVDIAVDHARTRNIYGQPIVELGAINEHLMRMMALDLVVAATALKASLATNRFGANAGYFTAVAKYVCCRLAEEAVSEGRQVLGARALLEDLPYARFVRDVLVYGTFDGTSHLMLDHVSEYLLRFVDRRHKPTLDMTREIYALPPRLLRDATRQPWRPYAPGVVGRCQDLAEASGIDAAGHLAIQAQGLVDLVACARAAGLWSGDQALRFQAAATLTTIEALLATCELALPAGRAVCAGPETSLEAVDRAAVDYALGWLGARVTDQVRELSFLIGPGGGERISNRLPQLGLTPQVRRALRELALAGSTGPTGRDGA